MGGRTKIALVSSENETSTVLVPAGGLADAIGTSPDDEVRRSGLVGEQVRRSGLVFKS